MGRPTTLTARFDPGVDPELEQRVTRLLSGLTHAFDVIRNAAVCLGPATVDIIVAADISDAVRALDGCVVGVERLAQYEGTRPGGVVGGKTMFRDDAHAHAVIVLDSAVFHSPTPAARVGEIFMASHELAHALVGHLRATGGGQLMPTSLPWKASRWHARYALEEYFADRLASVVLAQCGSASTSDRSTRPLMSTDFGMVAEVFVAAAAAELDVMGAAIDEYRCGDRDLIGMWLDVAKRTTGVLNALAHAQAEVDAQSDEPAAPVTAAIADTAPSLHRLWQSIHPLAIELFPAHTPHEFVQREIAALDLAGDAIVAFWAELGLTFRPDGDGFYITVAPPPSRPAPTGRSIPDR